MKKIFLAREWESFTLYHWFILSCCFSLFLLSARVIITGHTSYVFLLWNLFLAFVPYAITRWLERKMLQAGKLTVVVLAGVWLLFIPNAFYILTDLFHLHEMALAPEWFDLLLLLSFAWNGLFLGLASSLKMEKILHRWSGRTFGLIVIFPVMSLNAYGIYIGRFLHYNSWDVVMQPFSLLRDLLAMLIHPFQNLTDWGMIFCYAVFMTLLYMVLKAMTGGISQIKNH